MDVTLTERGRTLQEVAEFALNGTLFRLPDEVKVPARPQSRRPRPATHLCPAPPYRLGSLGRPGSSTRTNPDPASGPPRPGRFCLV